MIASIQKDNIEVCNKHLFPCVTGVYIASLANQAYQQIVKDLGNHSVGAMNIRR